MTTIDLPAPGALDQPLDEVQRDVRVEQFLQVYAPPDQYRFEPGLPIDNLDLHSAVRAQVRPALGSADGTLPDAVEQYINMRRTDGTHFPPGICHQLPNGRQELMDARQRVEAARALNMTRLPFYVLTTDDEEVLWKVALRANAELNGVPPGVEDVEQQILAYKVKFPNTPQVLVAALFKKSDKFVSKIVLRAKVNDRLEGLGFKTQAFHGADPEAAMFRPAVVTKLAPIQYDPVLKATAALINDAKATSTMIDSLVSEVGKQNSEADALALIDAHRTRNGWSGRIRKAQRGVVELPTHEHPVRERLLASTERLARQLTKYTTPAAAEMTDKVAAETFWGYVTAIEISARRIAGQYAKTK